MTFLLDTNVVSELTREHPDPNCLAWLEARRGQCAISTVLLAELRYGIERRPDGKEKSRLEKCYRFLTEDYRGRIWDFDLGAAGEWGRYAAELYGHYGADWWKTFDQRDTMQAAIARQNGLVVATRNKRHFPFIETIDPFDRESA
jgi:predicted nucleic acid-binding protein